MDKRLRSLVFSEWNKALGAAKRGQLDMGRTRKALRICLSGDLSRAIREYHTTMKSCGCPDRQQRGVWCKHMIAFVIMQRVYLRAQLIWIGEEVHPLDAKKGVRNAKVSKLLV